MAFLHQPIALNPGTYSSSSGFINGNSPTLPTAQSLSVYNREYGKDRGQLPLALVSGCPTGADIAAFDDDETEDGSSLPTVRDEEVNNGDRGDGTTGEDVDVVFGEFTGVGYGANVRSVATYYRMPIASPNIPTVPVSAVANSSRTTCVPSQIGNVLPTVQVQKTSYVLESNSSSAGGVQRAEPPTCYCCRHLIPSKTYLTTSCGHHYDPLCLQHLLTHSLHTLTLPSCCGVEISTRSFLHLLPFDSVMRKAWLEREMEMMALPKERERVYCPGGGCGAFVGGLERGEPRARVVKCPRCEREICTRCQREAHSPPAQIFNSRTISTIPNCSSSTTVESAEDREFLFSSHQQGWQRCFQCRRIVEVREGCNHVVCVCGAEFCYRCGNAWRPRSCECGVFSGPRHAST